MKQIARVLRVGLFLLLLITFFGIVLTAVQAQDDELSVTLTSEPYTVTAGVDQTIAVVIDYHIPSPKPDNIKLRYTPPPEMITTDTVYVDGSDWVWDIGYEDIDSEGNGKVTITLQIGSVQPGELPHSVKLAVDGVIGADASEVVHVRSQQQTAVTPPPPSPTNTLGSPNFEVITQTVTPIGDPNSKLASLDITFQNTGTTDSSAELHLIYPPNALEIKESTLNGAPVVTATLIPSATPPVAPTATPQSTLMPTATSVVADDETEADDGTIGESADPDVIDSAGDSTEDDTTDDATDDDEEETTPIWVWLIVIPLLLFAIVLIVFLIWRSRKGPPPVVVPPPPPVNSTAYLTRVSDGRHFDVAPLPFTIGRGAENALVIDESFENWQTVSRTHANIYQHAQGYVAEDQGSQNKIKVQGRTTRKSLVKDGWMLSIGGVEFIFNDGSNAGRTA